MSKITELSPFYHHDVNNFMLHTRQEIQTFYNYLFMIYINTAYFSNGLFFKYTAKINISDTLHSPKLYIHKEVDFSQVPVIMVFLVYNDLKKAFYILLS